MTPAVLRLDNVSKKFGELSAVDGVTLSVERGEILGIMGPNGSGKTTLLNLASGLYRPSSGHILFLEHDVHGYGLHDIVNLGLARSFQNPRIFGSLDTVRHTVTALRSAKTNFSVAGILSHLSKRWTEWSDEARSKLAIVFGDQIPQGRASALSYGQRRLLELVRCLSTDPLLLLLDEPTSGLNDQEAALLSGLLLQVARDHHITIVIVDHKFGFLRDLCSRIVIMNQGRIIADSPPAEILANAMVNEIYFGGAIA